MYNANQDSIPEVFVATAHQEFAADVSRQLPETEYTVRCFSTGKATQKRISANPPFPIAFVDCGATTDQALPLHALIRSSWPRCKTVLICAPEQISTGADLVRSSMAWDYVLADAPRDPERIPLLVRRACQGVGNTDATRQQYQEIIQTLRDLRRILKSGDDCHVVDLLNKFKAKGCSAPALEPLLREISDDSYKDCLIELICGRLRRLENQILLTGQGIAQASTPAAVDEILVVEDSDTCADLAKNILRKHGFDVTVATSALDAREALLSRPPALVLMDVHLDDACGIELVKLMRRRDRWSKVPVIIVTSDRMRDTLREAIDVKVQDYLLKPYEPDVLVERVKSVLAQSRAGVTEVTSGA